jgi:glycine cleavage system H protein
MLKYNEEHEWVKVDGDVATIGISDYAQQQLGDVVYVEVPEVGATLDKGDDLCVVESVKAASEVYAPISGEVIAVNTELEDNFSLVNESPLDAGWIAKIKMSQMADMDLLMDEAAYASHIEGLD